MVAEKRCGASLVASKTTAMSLAPRRLLRTEAEAKEEVGKCKWECGVPRANAGEVEGALWLGVAWLVRATVTRDLHFHHAVASVCGRSATEDRTSWPSEPQTKPDDAI